MRKLFTTISTVMLAALLTVTAGAQATKTTRGAAESKAPVATIVDRGHGVKCDVSKVHTSIPALLSRQNATAPLASAKKGTPFKFNADRTSMPTTSTRPLRVPANVNLNGSVVYSFDDNTWQYGIYTIPALDLVALDIDATYGGAYTDGMYFVGTYMEFLGMAFCGWAVYNTEDWSTINSSWDADGTAVAVASCGDPNDPGMVYGCFYKADFSGMEFASWNLNTMTYTSIADLSIAYCGVGIAADGTFYAINKEGKLLKVDKATGAETVLAELGLTSTYATSGAVDARSNTMFYATCNDTGGMLYTIDLATATVTDSQVYDYEVTGMFVLPPLAEDGAPAAVEDCAVSFAEGSLNGAVSFTAPSTTFIGGTLSEGLSYTVYANGVAVGSGTTTAGASVIANVALADAGMYTFYVTTANSVGESPKSNKVVMWVGPDAPEAPENVTLTYVSGQMALVWDAVTASVHDGYFDADEVTYTVNKYVNGVFDSEVANGLTVCQYSEAVAVPEDLTVVEYSVVAKFQGTPSAEVMSNPITLGSVEPPYDCDFEDATEISTFTIVDANGDSRPWTAYDGAMRVSYNSSMDMDDWLISPGLKLEAGKLYEVSIDAWGQSSYYVESFEVKAGASATPEGMTIEVIGRQDTNSTTPETYTAVLEVATSGVYYIGIHGISAADMYYLYVDNFAVSAPFSANAPGIVSNVKFVPDPAGAPKATVKFNAPSVTANGGTLAEISKIEVSRGDAVVKTFDTPAVGAALEFVDEVSEEGDYTYTFVAYNAEGAGQSYKAVHYMGAPYAAAPDEVSVMEAYNNPGEAIISWAVVAEDNEGNPLDPEAITYNVYNDDLELLGSVKASDAEYGYCEMSYEVPGLDGGQIFFQAVIIASTARGENREDGFAWSDLCPVGTPYQLPYVESMTNGEIEHILAVATSGWSISSSCLQPACSPQDNDGGMIVFNPSSVGTGAESDLSSGKIALGMDENTCYSFYYFPTEGKSYEFVPIVKMYGYAYALCDWISSENTTGEDAQWTRVIVPMVDYLNQTVQVGIAVRCLSYDAILCFDNMQVGPIVANDLAVSDFQTPKSIQVGKESLFNVIVFNNGSSESGSYTVNLLRDGEVVESIEQDGLGAGYSASVIFSQSADLFSPESAVFAAEVVYDADENVENNRSENVTVPIIQSMLPNISDLNGEEVEGGVDLSWTQPNIESSNQQVVEDVEDYEAFAINNAGDWTMIDADGGETYGPNGVTFEGKYEPCGWMVFNASDAGVAENYGAVSGDQYFVCWASVPEGAVTRNDDWLISPELPGVAQTLKFYARGWTTQYGYEKFEVLYSTSGKAPEDFTVIATVDNTPAEWTEYSFDLPEGTAYFAIRCISADVMALMVDDISFVMGTGAVNLLGYNVYRDGVKINEDLVSQPSYFDAEVEAGKQYTYYVTAVFAQGESALSNPFSLTLSGLESLKATNMAVVTEPGSILVSGVEGLNIKVLTVDGKLLYTTTGASQNRFTVAPGVYMVNAGNKTVKVIVK